MQFPGYASVAHQHHSYVARGHYADQLERWLARVPARPQLLILVSEDFFADTAGVVGQILDFLELPPMPGAPRFRDPQRAQLRRDGAGHPAAADRDLPRLERRGWPSCSAASRAGRRERPRPPARPLRGRGRQGGDDARPVAGLARARREGGARHPHPLLPPDRRRAGLAGRAARLRFAGRSSTWPRRASGSSTCPRRPGWRRSATPAGWSA